MLIAQSPNMHVVSLLLRSRTSQHDESHGQVKMKDMDMVKVMDKSTRWKLWTSQHDTKRCELFIMVQEWTQHLLLVIKNTCAFIIQNSNKPVSLNDVSLGEGIPEKITFLLDLAEITHPPCLPSPCRKFGIFSLFLQRFFFAFFKTEWIWHRW